MKADECKGDAARWRAKWFTEGHRRKRRPSWRAASAAAAFSPVSGAFGPGTVNEARRNTQDALQTMLGEMSTET